MDLASRQEVAGRQQKYGFRRVGFLGGELDLATFAQVIDGIVASLKARRRIQIVALNVAKQVGLRKHPALRQHVIESDIVIADGMGIVFGARLLGHDVPERITGIDLFQALLTLCEKHGHSVFLLGATGPMLAAAVAKIRKLHPGLQIVGARHGYFSAAEIPGIVDQINRSQADCLFVALPSPAKELFLSRHGGQLAPCLRMGIGGSLDVVSGHKRRAPRWMQRAGLEWLWRTLLEPRRLFWRYFSTNTVFLGLLLRARVSSREVSERNRSGAPSGSRPRALRVLQVYGGGLRLKSGISRNLEYLFAASKDRPDLPQHVLIDPRGPWPVPLGLWAVLAPFHLCWALVRGTWLLASSHVDLVHVRVTAGCSTLRKLPFLLLAKLFGKPVLIHLHSGKYEAHYAAWPKARRALARTSFRAADRVLVLGPRMHAFVARELGVAERAIVTLPNAVAGPRHPPARDARDDVCRITFVGALLEQKGLPELFDALEQQVGRAQRWCLTLIGDGDRNFWSTQAARRGILERVRFTGWLSRAQVSAVLAETDVFVLPSHVEGLSLAVLEAMAHGCAIITTRVGDHADALEPDEEGILIPPRNVAALADALRSLIDSPAERTRLGHAARARHERCHTVEGYATRLARIYSDVLSPSAERGRSSGGPG